MGLPAASVGIPLGPPRLVLLPPDAYIPCSREQQTVTMGDIDADHKAREELHRGAE